MSPIGRALGLLVLLLGGCVSAAARPSPEPSAISVRGTGRVAVKPDTAFVNVGVETRDPALAAATAEATRRMTAVLTRVKALGVAVADIATVAYSLDPVMAPRRSEEEPSRIIAYRVLNLVRIRIRDVAAAGPIVDAVVAAGANTVSSLQFTLNDPEPVEREARAKAVNAAAVKARELAAAAGVALGKVLSIEEDSGARPVMTRAAGAVLLSGGPGPVETGELEVVVGVQMRYQIGTR